MLLGQGGTCRASRSHVRRAGGRAPMRAPNRYDVYRFVTAATLAASGWLCARPTVATAEMLVASASPISGGNDVLNFDFNGAPNGSLLGNLAGVLGTPRGIALGNDGNLYIADAANGEIWRFNAAAGTLNPFVAGGGGLLSPDGLALDASGNLFVADAGAGQVFEYDSSGNLLNSGPFIAPGAGGLISPAGLAFDAQGNLYVADAGGGQVLQYDAAGNLLGGGPLIANGLGGLVSPTALAFDNGNLYIANAVSGFGNSSILEYDTLGNLTTLATGLTDPTALAFDASGNLFISDAGTGQVMELPSAGGSLSVFIGAGFDGLGTPEGLAYFPTPEPVPESCSLSLFGMAAVAAVLFGHRRNRSCLVDVSGQRGKRMSEPNEQSQRTSKTLPYRACHENLPPPTQDEIVPAPPSGSPA